MPKYDKKVVEVFENLEKKYASAKSYGAPHAMLELMNQKAMQSAYPGNWDDLKNYVEYCADVYDAEAHEKKMGYDLSIMKEEILVFLYKKLAPAMECEDIILAHLWWALCSESKYFRMENFLESNGISKIQVFCDLAGYCDVDSVNFDKIRDYCFVIDTDKKKTTLKIRKSEEEAPGTPAPAMASMGGSGYKPNPKLSAFCEDLIAAAKSYDKPFIGREDVIIRTLQVLCKAEKSNPVHVGEPGVGKSAVTKGLAKKILNGDVPDILKGSQLYSLNLTAVTAGTIYRGQFEERIKFVLDELSKMPKPILFIDEIHMLLGAGSASDSSMDAANIMKPYLTEGKIKFIGATTYREYQQKFEKDPALVRRFQKIEIKEPSIEDSIGILKGLKDHYEKYHHVTYTDEAIRSAVELTSKCIHDRFLPDKAIDMIDEAGAYANITPGHAPVIEEEDIEHVIAAVCKIPAKTVKRDDLKVVAGLEKELKQNVFGQDEAVEKLTECIKISKSGLGDETKPIGAFLFVGPSGVGKTELAKQLAKSMSMDLIRLDMSEYASEASISKLIGSSSGLVGYDEGGILTNALLKNPYSVLLLDEVEKAHPKVFNTFLQVLDYGMLTDNHGRKVNCKNAIIIMTSNAGVAAANKPTLGFGSTEAINKDAITDAVNQFFTVEFRNRLSAVVTFNGINEEMSVQVARKELNFLKEKMAKKGFSVTFSDACVKKIAKDGTSYQFGARNLQRLIDQKIKKIFVDRIISETMPKESELDVMDENYELIPIVEKEEKGMCV